ncbi:MAG: DNA repair protein RadC [Anaerolineae bacterium]|nr:DNA repair protein RadC [Anaerolineae bacterium]
MQRLLRYGAGALSYAELLQVVLSAGDEPIGFELVSEYKSLGTIARAGLIELQTFNGIGQQRAARLQATFELGKRLAKELPTDRPQVRSPSEIAQLFMPEMSLLEQEQMRILLLDTKNRVAGIVTAYQGSVHTTVIRIAELFREAIRRNVPSIALVHNHPSGDATPSPEDCSITREVVKAGALLDIEIIDHIVIGDHGRFVSLKERGLGF